LNLAAQAIDLHVNGPLADRIAVAIAAGKLEPRHGLARRGREQAHHLTLAISEMDHLLAALEVAATEVEYEFAKAHRLERWRWRGARAVEDVADPARELARFEWLADIVVSPALEPLDAAFRLAACGQHQDRYTRARAQIAGKLEAALTRHHDIENHQ